MNHDHEYFRSKAIRQESSASAAAVLGRFEEAAIIHAKLAKMFWTERMFEDAASSIIRASECLIKADMPEDAFEGIRLASTMMIMRGEAVPALRLGGYVGVLEKKYPNSFKICSIPFQSYLMKLCVQKKLI